MKIHLHAYSQYDEAIKTKFRSSACGPTAVATILSYYEQQRFSVNTLYKLLHCTPIGLPSYFLLHFSKKILGQHWQIQRITLADALKELDEQRPVILKFDRYFNRQFWKRSYFAYHWTVLVDYYVKKDALYLQLEDLGGPNRKSRRIDVLYTDSKHALTFIQMRPL